MPVGGRRKAAICGLLHRPLRVATIPDYRMIAVVVNFVMDMLRGAGLGVRAQAGAGLTSGSEWLAAQLAGRLAGIEHPA